MIVWGMLRSMFYKKTLSNLNFHVQSSSYYTVCSAYQLGKSHRLPLSHVHTCFTIPFEIVHVDIWASSAIISLNGM